MRGTWISWCGFAFVAVAGAQITAAVTAAPPNESLAGLAKEVLLESLPPEFEKRKDWGRQKEVFAGYEWVWRGGRWHFDERKKKVNDGLWRMYRARLVNPEKNLRLRIGTPRSAADGRTALEVDLTARLWTEARQERWRLGVKGLNFHIEAEATVSVRLDMEIGVRPAASGGFGAIEIRPKVTNVDLRLDDLSLKRVSKIGGDLAQELGNGLREVVEGELRDREPELQRKINGAIAKHRDRLRFSPSEIAALGWERIKALLGASDDAG